MAQWLRDGSLAWLLVNETYFHLPRRSAWRLGSTVGTDVSFGTPEIKFALDRARIAVPISRVENGLVVENQVLQGYGMGASAGINVSVPYVNYGWSTAEDPGSGTPIYESPFCPEPLEAKHLQGICIALSASATRPGSGADGRQGSVTTLIFGDKLSFGTILPTSINAVAFVDGMSTVRGSFASVGAEVVFYNVVTKSTPKPTDSAR